MKASAKLGEILELDAEQIAFVDENLRVKTERKTAEVKFHFVPGFELGKEKIPNQAKFLLDAITESEDPVTYADWGALAVSKGMGTKQDPARIAAYYRPTLEKLGAVAKA